MIEAIEGAEETIEFLTFIYWQGDIALQFADALSAAAARGVKVRVLLDAFGAKKMSSVLVDRLEAAGCEIAWYHPVSWYTLKRLNNRTHRKVLVVDREVGFTGGVGIAEEWTGTAQDPGHWRDNHFRLHGPVVRHLHAAFAENWRRATGEVMAHPIPTDELAGRGRSRATPLATSPRGRESDIGVMYLLLLTRAQETIDIATPYFVPDRSMVDAIVATVERGVTVRLLVPGPHLDKKVVQWASYASFGDLIDAGVEVWEYQPTMMHVKSMVADGRWTVIGSANFDNRSLELNDELVVLVDDTRLAEQVTEHFDADLEQSRRLGRDQIRRIRLYKRLLIWAALTVQEHL
jgi:cardiolipin synthase